MAVSVEPISAWAVARLRIISICSGVSTGELFSGLFQVGDCLCAASAGAQGHAKSALRDHPGGFCTFFRGFIERLLGVSQRSLLFAKVEANAAGFAQRFDLVDHIVAGIKKLQRLLVELQPFIVTHAAHRAFANTSDHWRSKRR